MRDSSKYLISADRQRIFRGPWQTIVDSVDEVARSHAILASKIEADVERPLKDYQSKNREMQAIFTIQSNLNHVAKDVENALKKASKLNTGKSSANKVANASSDVEAANQQWESQAPYVFEQLQALDENRVNHLRDVLTQFQTHEVDQVERNRATAEGVLNILLSIDTKDEISTFVAQNAAVDSGVDRPDTRSGRGSTAGGSTAAELPSLRSTPSRPSATAPQGSIMDRPSPFAASTRSATEGYCSQFLDDMRTLT